MILIHLFNALCFTNATLCIVNYLRNPAPLSFLLMLFGVCFAALSIWVDKQPKDMSEDEDE